MTINRISNNVIQLYFQEFGSCIYIIKLEDKLIMIDSSSQEVKKELLSDLQELNIKPKEINPLIITHSHWDHIGNNDLFPNAVIITSDNSSELPSQFKPILTPGHTKDSFCILYNEILFSGDTIFHNDGRGRTDLEGGSEIQILNSIEKLKKIDYKILCPGHL